MRRIFEDDSSAIERAKEVARKTLDGEYDPLLACRDLADLRGRLQGVSDETMNTFVGVASEVDGLPIGADRNNWASEALRSKDIEAADYRERVRATVEVALQALLTSLGGRH